MVGNEPQRDCPDHQQDAGKQLRLEDELIGLDRDDPEVQAFAAHLARAHRQHSGFTVEGSLSDVTEFAESANRARGPQRVVAVLLVTLLLLGVAIALWEPVVFLLSVLLG